MFFKKKYHYYFPLIFICGYYLFQSYFFEIHDFANYYFGGKFLSEGFFNSSIYFPYQFNKTITDLGYQNYFLSYAPNTPFLSIIFYPFSQLPLTVSKLIFNILCSCLFIFSIIRLSNYYKIKKEYLLFLPIIFFIPIKNNLLFGQVYFLLFFLLSEGFLAYQKKRYKTLAVYWSLAIFLKVFPILLVLFLIFKKKNKATLYLIISCILILLFSVLITGVDIWLFYFSSVLNRASNGEIAGAFVDNYQSIFMFLKRLFVYDNLYNETSISNKPKLFYLSLIFFKSTLFGVLFYITKTNKNDLLNFSFWLLASIIISPYGSTYTFILLIFIYFPILLFFKKKLKIILLILLFLITNNTLFNITLFPFNYSRIFFLLFFLTFIIWKIRETINFKKIGFFTFLVVLISFFTYHSKSNSDYLINEKTPILTYDYSIIDNKLIYHFWNQKGTQSKKTNIKITSIDSSLVKILNNQVYYKNNQLTFDNANKLKPALINNSQIVFLSDKNRGVGFYELHKIIIK